MNDQPQHDREQPTNEIPAFNTTESARLEQECLLWEVRRERLRRQEAQLACLLLELAARQLLREIARLTKGRRQRRPRPGSFSGGWG